MLSMLCASLVVFFIVQLTPGDMAEVHNLAPETAAKLNLDKPALLQYFYWLGNCLTLDFSVSLTNGTPVLQLLKDFAGTTFVLTVCSLFLSVLLSIPVALYLGTSPDSRLGKLLSSLVYGISAIPVFVVGYIALAFVFGVLKIYPLDPPTGSFEFWPWTIYYILPIVVLALGNGTLGEFVRVLSLEVRTVNHSLYVKAARSRGTTLFRQFFRPVVIPFLSVVISRFAVLMGGVIVVERIFNRHGLGWLTWEATLNRDFFVIMAVSLLTAFFIRLLMLGHDLLSYFLDPRLRRH